MKLWAKTFYKSRSWRDCRDAYFTSQHGLCERCSQPGKIVHHKIWLTPENINNPNISLNFEHLELLCQTCHNQEHTSGAVTVDGLRFDESGNLIQVTTDKNERLEAALIDNLRYTKRYLGGETMPVSFDWVREQEKTKRW